MTAAPGDEHLRRTASAESTYSSLQDDIALAGISSELAAMDTQVADLPVAIQTLRSRGYVKGYLERKADALGEQWTGLRPRVQSAFDEHVRALRNQTEALGQRVRRLRYVRDSGELAAVESGLSELSRRVSAAASSLQSTYSVVKDNLDQTGAEVKEVAWILDQLEAATFRLYPDEGMISAVKGQWMTGEKEGPKGILYLTEERLLFEQKEEVATKKVLFVTTQKQRIQELKWESALRQLRDVKATERGGVVLGIGKKEMLDLQFSADASIQDVSLRLEADSDSWQRLIGRARSGDIAGERTQPKDKAAVEAARAAPTKCPTCGATLAQPIVRGMTEIKCEYCGGIVRV